MPTRFIAALAIGLLLSSATAFADPGVEREISELTTRLEAAPHDARLLVRRADLRRRVARYDEAMADLALAEVTGSSPAKVYLVRARILVDRGDEDGALSLLEGALDSMPARDRAEAFALLAGIHQEAGRLIDAVHSYDAALSLRDDVELYLSRGRLLIFAGRAHEAIAGYEAGVVALGGAVVLRVELIELLVAGGAHDRALTHASALVASSRAPSRFLLLRALAHEGLGDAARAREDRLAALADAERVLARRGSAMARLARARALLALGRTDEARADLERVVRRAPQLDEARVLLHRVSVGGAR